MNSVIADMRTNRDDIAIEYARLIRDEYATTDWGAINTQILMRYTKSGLTYIKARAWRIIDQASSSQAVQE